MIRLDEQLKKYSEFLTYCKSIDSVTCKSKYFSDDNDINIINSQKNLKVKIKK